MANRYLQALSLLPSPTVNPSGGLSSAAATMQAGANKFMKVANDLRQTQRSMAISRLLGSLDTSDPFTASTKALEAILGIGASPQDAARLSAAVAAPGIDRLNYDLKRRQLSQPSYATATDDFGNIYMFDRKTGEMKKVQSSPYSGTDPGGGSGGKLYPPKLVDTRTVTEKDPLGNETTYAVRTSKVTGEVISKTPIGKGTKPISQQDKDSINATKKSLDLIDRVEEQVADNLVGPIDAAFAWGSNAVGVPTQDTIDTNRLDATLQNLKANLTAALIKGVPSDKDMAVIEGMLPSVWDSAPVFKAKLENIREILKRQGAQFTQEYLDPIGAGEIGISAEDPSKAGTTKQKENPYGPDYEIISF